MKDGCRLKGGEVEGKGRWEEVIHTSTSNSGRPEGMPSGGER